MNQNKQLIILENFSVLFEDCIQSSPAWDDRRVLRQNSEIAIALLDVIASDIHENMVSGILQQTVVTQGSLVFS